MNKKTWRTDQLRWDKHVAGRLGNKPMDKVTPGDITNLMTDLKAAGYAPASVKHILVLIKRLYNWSSKQGLYKGANPATRVTAPKVNNARTECLTREEIGRLMAVLDAHRNRPLALMVKFALLTGLRRGEIFKLDWRNVSLDEGFITLIDPKGGKDTVLPLSLAALDVLRQARDNQLSDPGTEWPCLPPVVMEPCAQSAGQAGNPSSDRLLSHESSVSTVCAIRSPAISPHPAKYPCLHFRSYSLTKARR